MAVPKLRFKREDGTEYPEWKTNELKTIFPKIRNGFVGTVSDSFADKETGIRYIEGTNIHNGIISDDVEIYVTKAFHENHLNSQLKADDIVMVQSGHIGDCAVVGAKYAGSNCHALIIMSNGGHCDSRFYSFYFHCDSGYNKMKMYMQGNTVKHILASDMQTFIVPIPDLEEQQKIADFLSTVDEVIAQSEAEVQNLEQQKKAAMQKIFSQEVRFKREDGTEYPKWEKRELKAVGTFIRGLSYSKYNVTSDNGNTLVLRSNNIGEDKTLDYTTGLQFVNKSPKTEQLLQKNDIVICMANGSNRLVGKTAQYDGKYSGVITVGAFCGIFRCNLPIIRYIFQSPDYLNFLLLNLKGGDGAIANLKGEDILNFSTFFPCLEEQQKIADFLSAYDEAISYAKQELDKWKELKKGLLQQMFV